LKAPYPSVPYPSATAGPPRRSYGTTTDPLEPTTLKQYSIDRFMQSKQLKDMDEETKTVIGSFVKSADNYQNLVISNLPNVAV